MKNYKCLICDDERITEDNIIIVICKACQESMHEMKE